MSKCVFPPEEWGLTESCYDPQVLEKNATLYFLGNGYLGLRGGAEESRGQSGSSHKGTFINGFYETAPQTYGEHAYGFPDQRQVLLNLPDLSEVTLYLDDEIFNLHSGRIIEYRRSLSLEEGLLYRDILWESRGGRKCRYRSVRCVSMNRHHTALLSITLSGITGTRQVKLCSGYNTQIVKHNKDKSDPRTGAGFAHNPLVTDRVDVDGSTVYIAQHTENSALYMGSGIAHGRQEGWDSVTYNHDPAVSSVDFTSNPAEVTELHLDKYVCYYTSIETAPEAIEDLVRTDLRQAVKDGCGVYLEEHRQRVGSFWNAADIRIEGDPVLQQGIRFNLFSLFQSAGRDGLRSVPAKGLSGEGYEGHYFWDTEIYILPFFIYTRPDIAGRLLEYRYRTLPAARKRAAVMNEKGALYPWRTINGTEASAFFPAGTAQYHINADIVYGIQKYVENTGDLRFLCECGAEIIFECARLWCSLGHWNSDGSFRIDCVTGPDEYTALVNNNLFTNMMARNNLNYAVRIASVMEIEEPDCYEKLKKRLQLEDSEVKEWSMTADSVYLPYDKTLCIYAQDDSFLSKKKWNFSSGDTAPLLLRHHPLVLYRHQVLKQPDTVLASFLLGRDFPFVQKIRCFDYYDPLTTGDSSLAPAVQCVIAAEIGRTEAAESYFEKTVRMDLDDVNGNVADGIHAAAMAGSWMALIYGFAGMRDYDGQLSFSPELPVRISAMEFRLRHGNSLVHVKLNHETAEYSLDKGDPLVVKHRNEAFLLENGRNAVFSLAPALKAVLLDLDGVITNTSELHYVAWSRLCREIGVEFDRDLNERLRGISRRESLDIILAQAGKEMPDAKRLEYAEKKNEYYREMIANIKPESVYPGIREFLSSLKERGIKTALVSASLNAETVVSALGLSGYFDAAADPGAVEKGKPDPELFINAAEMLGVEPRDCAGIEDAASGIAAFRACGMRSVGIGSSASSADICIDSPSDLTLKLLERLFSN